jgi:conjugal transfer mating pair stabilization protein TraG
MVKQDASATIPPATYTPLLNTIAKGESNGNYNAYFGHSDNTTILFTEMTIAQVLKWQEDYVNGGSYSSAVGRYQIVRPTLAGLVKRHSIDLNAKYDEAMQDNLAIKLLERRGSVDYFEKKLTREQFAANLAQEWAALPKIIGENPEESYYAKDGVNKSRVTMAEIFQALASLEV